MDQISNAQLMAQMQQASKAVSKACGGGNHGSTGCAAAKKKKAELVKKWNKQNPLPAPGKFETVVPNWWETLLSVIGCGYGVTTSVTYIGGVIAAATCGAAAYNIGQTVVPQQRRVP